MCHWIVRYHPFKTFSWNKDRGRTTREMYINNCTPKLTKNFKSRYFVTIEDINIPKPRPSIAINKIKNGNNRINLLGCKSHPLAR